MALTKEDLNAIKLLLDERFEGVDERFNSIDERFNDIDKSLGSMDERLKGVEHDVKYIKVVQLENNVVKRLNEIESCYTSTYDRYRSGSERFETAIADIDVMKLAIQKNSEEIQKLKHVKNA